MSTKDQRTYHVKNWQSSNISKAAYCRKYNLNYAAFIKWFLREDKIKVVNESKGRFIDLSSTEHNNNTNSLIIEFANGIKITYAGSLTLELLSLLKDA